MEKLYTRISDLKLLSKIKSSLYHFSKREWYVFLFLLTVLTISTLFILQNINKSFMVEVPRTGGSFTEGIVGTPRFINPILATSDADRDLTSLVYSGLLRKAENGKLVEDLAQKFETSKDGLTYTFTLKDKIYFQDGEKLTADDIVFTINTVKDPATKSPYQSNWDGIAVEKIDDKTIKFSLKKPYASFLDNTTFGIVPKHIWEDGTIELNEANTNPVGSGPFQVSDLSKQSSGIIDYYVLEPFNKFVLGKPKLNKITLRFYPNEKELIDAFLKNEINQLGSISPDSALKLKEDGYTVESSTLPRIFGLFFNQNQNQLFTDKNVVKALDLAIDKDRIVGEVLQGFGVVIDNPIPPNMISYQKLNVNEESSMEEKMKKAQEILEKSGWKKNVDGYLEKTTKDKKKTETKLLEFSISTGNADDLVKSANIIKENLESLGVKVEVKTFEIGNLNQMVIRPRKYDALLFGQIINKESDLFAFWHSSQRNDPGLNVAMYTNTKVDKILEDAFVTTDENTRVKKYAQFEDEIKKDMPAVFLYSPDFIYVVSKDLKNLSISHITSPQDRFINSYLWYTKTDNVWKVFSKNY